MTIEEMREKMAGQIVVWNCIHRRDQHEIGCPHKEWTKEQLLEVIIMKKKFEQANLKGTVLTN